MSRLALRSSQSSDARSISRKRSLSSTARRSEADGTPPLSESSTPLPTALTQILVRLHVEPHRKQREEQPKEKEQCDEYHCSGGWVAPLRVAGYGLHDSDGHPEKRHQETKHVEEDERMEVADHVLLPHSPPETLEQEPRNLWYDLAEADPGALADVVDRPRRDVADPCVPDVEVHEHVIWIAVPRV